MLLVQVGHLPYQLSLGIEDLIGCRISFGRDKSRPYVRRHSILLLSFVIWQRPKQYISKREMGVDGTPDGRPQGPTQPILSPLAPTIRRIGPPRPCIVGAGEDGMWGWGPCGCPSVHIITSLLLIRNVLPPLGAS